jgi:hypothetical protein
VTEEQRGDQEELCEAEGHRYAGDDHPEWPEDGGRCWCGKMRYPVGGDGPGTEVQR